MEVGGGGARVAFGAKVEAGLQPAENRRRVSYGYAIGYYEAAPSALDARRIEGHPRFSRYLNSIVPHPSPLTSATATTAFADAATLREPVSFCRFESGVGGHCATLRALCHRTP
jgi:hypothetical protein